MRTLKKALSLVLVLAMVFALAVPGFAAVTKGNDYSDYADVTNKEAVDVLTAIGVIHGNTDGSFGPEGNFTRAQAATMITYMMLGTTVADALSAGATQFNDVPATHWAAKYVQYCANEGIINGYGDGNFGPDAQLTNAQWALMLLGALGYKAQNEGIGGAGWEIKTTSLAMQAGVASAEDMTGSFNRDIAAKMAFNTLTADLVEYGSNGVTINGSDLSVVVGASKASKIEQGTVAETMQGEYLQFAERHFPKLVLENSEDDGMGRPCNKWTLTNETDAIGTYAKTANKTVYVTASNNDLTKVLKAVNKNFNKDSAVYTLNGEPSSIAADVKLGDQVEIYTDKDNANKITKVVVTHYTVSKATGDAATRVSGDNTQVRVPGVAGVGAFNSANTTKTVIGYNGIKEGDIVLSYKDSENVYHLEKAQSIDGTLSAYSATTLTVSGTRYNISGATGTMAADKLQELHKASAVWYLDKGGNIVHGEGTAVTQLAYVLDAMPWNAGWNEIYKAKLVNLETGAVDEIDTEEDYSGLKGQFVRYSEKDGVYSLSAVGAYAAETAGQTAAAKGAVVTIKKGNPTIKLAADGAEVRTNSATVFLMRNYKSSDKAQDLFTVYNGYTAVPSFTGTVADGKVHAVVYRGANGYAQYVVIDPASIVSGTTSANDMFYVVDNTVHTTVDENGATGYYVTGLKINSTEIENLVFSSRTEAEKVANDTAYIATTYNDKDQIVSARAITGSDTQYFDGEGTGMTTEGVLSLDGVAYGYNDDTVVFYVNEKNEVSVGTATDLETDDNDTFVAVRVGKTESDNGFYTLKAIFVKEVADVDAPAQAAVPTASKKADITTAETNASVDFEVEAETSDGGTLSYAWSIQKEGEDAAADATTAAKLAKAFTEEGKFTVTCTVTNTLGESTATTTVTWTVTVSNP